MVIGIIGENCAGKSTLAGELQKAFGGEVVTGKDYLRLAKSEAEAEALFRKKLAEAVGAGSIIYVISEEAHLRLLPEGAVKILVTADLETIRERFRARMHGNLPPPVAQMLEKKHGMFDGGRYDFRFDGVKGDPGALCEALKGRRE